MDVSIGKLNQLVTVARTGSFSRAAAELNISQPALSRSIASIENSCGFQIFNRMGHGVEPTAAGLQVLAQAEPLLRTLRVFNKNLGLLGSGKAGTLSIGLAPLLASQLLARCAVDFFTATTQAQLQVMVRPGAVLVESLGNDQIEMFFFPEGYIQAEPDMIIEAVGRISPVCVVRSSHPLARRKGLGVADLAGYAWATSVLPPVIEKELNPPQFICDNYHILREAVLESDLICICSHAFVEAQIADGSLVQIRVKGLSLPSTMIYSARLAGRISSPLANAMEQRIRAQLL